MCELDYNATSDADNVCSNRSYIYKLCIFSFFALCFSVFLYLFIVMSCLLPFSVYFVYDFYTNNNNNNNNNKTHKPYKTSINQSAVQSV